MALLKSQACFIDTDLITNVFQSDIQSKQHDLLHPYALDSDKSPQKSKLIEEIPLSGQADIQ